MTDNSEKLAFINTIISFQDKLDDCQILLDTFKPEEDVRPDRFRRLLNKVELMETEMETQKELLKNLSDRG